MSMSHPSRLRIATSCACFKRVRTLRTGITQALAAQLAYSLCLDLSSFQGGLLGIRVVTSWDQCGDIREAWEGTVAPQRVATATPSDSLASGGSLCSHIPETAFTLSFMAAFLGRL